MTGRIRVLATAGLAFLVIVFPAPVRADISSGTSRLQPSSSPAGADAADGIERYRRYYAPRDDEPPKNGAVRVTFLGTATLLVDDGETQLMIDGFFSRPPFLKVAAWRIRTDTAAVDAALARAGVDSLKALFVAHSHYDHVLDAAYVARQTGAVLYGSASTLNVGRGGGLVDDRMVLYEPGRKVAVGRFIVTVLPSKHSPPIRWVNDDLGETIDRPLRQPARYSAYREGGSFDMLIERGDLSLYVKPATNYVEGALDDVRADVLFLATARLGSQDEAFREAYYEQTVGRLRPHLVIPIHWDNFFRPLGELLEPLADTPAGFDDLIGRLSADGIGFTILQGYQGVTLQPGMERSGK